MCPHPVSEGPIGTDPPKRLRELIDILRKAIVDFVAFLPIFGYFFFYWNLKVKSRHALHIGALSFLSLSLVLLAFEVALEIAGKDLLLHFLHAHPTLEPVLFGFFVLSILVVLAHHQRERRHARHEYSLAEVIWQFLENRHQLNEDSFMKFALNLTRRSFEQRGASHVCVWQHVDDHYEIPAGCVLPDTSDPSFLKTLGPHQGVVPLVAQDRVARYVPRLYFPINSGTSSIVARPFPHALKFEVARVANGFIEVVRSTVNVGAVAIPNDAPPFRSFVAVPLRSSDDEFLGVLCVDFRRTDPLDTTDIKRASVLGVIIADELVRLRRGSTRPTPDRSTSQPQPLTDDGVLPG